MKIAINVLPLKSKHKDRGIGLYTSNLISNLRKHTELEVQEFLNISEVLNADIVHYPWFDFFFPTLKLKKTIKTVVTIHDVIPLLFPESHLIGIKGRFNFFRQKYSLNKCNQIITDSFVSKNDISKTLKISSEKISVVYLAANNNFITQSDTRLLYIKRKYKLSERFLLYVGDANWVKNLPFLINGFNQLIQDPEFKDVKLILVGGVFLKNVENFDHPELQSLKKVNRLINEFNLINNVIRPGDLNLEELVAFYNLATIYVQPSLYEGFGFPLIEAFACGAPVVSSEKGSLKEIGGDAAIYFDPNNLLQFITILKEVLENKSLRERLSKAGFKQANKFSWEKVAEDTRDVYLKVLKND